MSPSYNRTWYIRLMLTRQYRLEIKGSLGPFMPKSKAEVVLMLLLESGLAYIIFWACLFRRRSTSI